MRTILTDILIVLAVLTGFGGGYLLWDKQANWYKADIAKLEPGPDSDLIRYGKELIVNTPRHIGKSAEDPAMAYGGNDLACQSCHLKAGLQPFAAPFVSTVATFPMMVDNRVIPLTTRINACMELGLNGRALPDESREMAGLIAYMKFIGTDTPEVDSARVSEAFDSLDSADLVIGPARDAIPRAAGRVAALSSPS